jgi:UDP-glucose 4-epimerase
VVEREPELHEEPMHRKKALVTGGAGFLGSHLVDRMVAEEFDVTVIDNLSRGIHTEGNFRFVEGDVNRERDLQSLDGVDIVVHCAALCGVEQVVNDPKRIIDDFIGTYNICEFVKDRQVDKFVFMSSGEIYGSEAINAKEDDDVVLWNTHHSRTNYALAKLMGEALTRSLQVQYNIIRPFNVFGIRQRGTGVVRNFYSWACSAEPLQVFNHGSELRAMCYIDDFIEGCWQAILRETPTGVYNIGNPYNTMTVNRIAQTVIDVTSSTSDIVYVEKDYIDKQGVTPNIDRAKNHLSYQPQVSLERGIKAMMNECNEGRKVER